MADDNIPTLTSIIRRGTPRADDADDTVESSDAGIRDLEALLSAASQKLTGDIISSSFAEVQDELMQRITARLDAELPEVLNRVLIEYFDIDTDSD